MFKLQLPFPPSVNTYWRHVGNRVLVSKKGRQYQTTVSSLLHRKDIKTHDGDLVVDIRLIPPDRRRRDVDNSLKALLDAMQFGGAYHDDAQIVRLTVEKHQPDPDDPRADGRASGGSTVKLSVLLRKPILKTQARHLFKI